MGTLNYGNGMVSAVIPDDVLAHLKLVATTKLRRHESFMLTWSHPDGEARGRSTLWLQPSIPLLFEFDSPDPIELDAEFLRRLVDAANSSAGVTLPRPVDSSAVPRPPIAA